MGSVSLSTFIHKGIFKMVLQSTSMHSVQKLVITSAGLQMILKEASSSFEGIVDDCNSSAQSLKQYLVEYPFSQRILYR